MKKTVVAVLLAFVLAVMTSSFGFAAPPASKSTAPMTPAKMSSTPKAPKAAMVEGKIAQWGKDAFTLDVKGKPMNFKYDSKKFAQVGKPVVGGMAKVWYKMQGKAMMATKIEVAKVTPKMASPAPKKKM